MTMPNQAIHFSDLAPRDVLTQLYWAAVRQALPAHTLAGFLPRSASSVSMRSNAGSMIAPLR